MEVELREKNVKEIRVRIARMRREPWREQRRGMDDVDGGGDALPADIASLSMSSNESVCCCVGGIQQKPKPQGGRCRWRFTGCF